MVVLLEFCRSNGEISVFGPLPGSPCARASGHQARPEVSRAPEEICFFNWDHPGDEKWKWKKTYTTNQTIKYIYIMIYGDIIEINKITLDLSYLSSDVMSNGFVSQSGGYPIWKTTIGVVEKLQTFFHPDSWIANSKDCLLVQLGLCQWITFRISIYVYIWYIYNDIYIYIMIYIYIFMNINMLYISYIYIHMIYDIWYLIYDIW